MSNRMYKCKITVIKRAFNQDLVDAYLDADEDFGVCQRFSDGQEFVLNDGPFEIPAGFSCPWAWTDLRNDIMTIAGGGDFPWMNKPGTTIAGCTDWFRPVIFKIERIE